MYQQFITDELKKILSNEEIKMFLKLQKIIARINKHSNITKLINGYDFWISQVYDSIWPFFVDKKNNVFS